MLRSIKCKVLFETSVMWKLLLSGSDFKGRCVLGLDAAEIAALA